MNDEVQRFSDPAPIDALLDEPGEPVERAVQIRRELRTPEPGEVRGDASVIASQPLNHPIPDIGAVRVTVQKQRRHPFADVLGEDVETESANHYTLS